MILQTPVECSKSNFLIDHNSHIMMLGSCFTDNIGAILMKNKFDCCLNPYGVLYNPLSISKAFDEIIECRRYTAEDLVFANGAYHSMMHHSSFSSSDACQCVDNINSSICRAHDFIYRSDWIILTLGSSFVYELNGNVVANCHKMPEKVFSRYLCPFSVFLDSYTLLIEKLLHINSRIKVVFTVSPIRHVRDTMHGNTLSKANLALFVNSLQEKYKDNVLYFPAYEIMNDELRDYRFYAEDMVHPSSVAIEYIWQKFCSMFFDNDTMKVLDRCAEIEKMLSHRPFNPESVQYSDFLCRVKTKIEDLLIKYPFLNFESELKYIGSFLKK